MLVKICILLLNSTNLRIIPIALFTIFHIIQHFNSILFLHFRPPELGKNKFLLSKATQLVVICYSSPRTLRRYPWASEVGGWGQDVAKDHNNERRQGQSKMRGQNGDRRTQDAGPPTLGARVQGPMAEATLRQAWRRCLLPVHTHLNGVLPRVLGS